MPRAVEFVVISQVCPSVFRFNGHIVAVDVSVRLLRAHDESDNTIDLFFQLWVRGCVQTVRRGFDPFGHIRIPMDVGGEGLPGLPFKLDRIDSARLFVLIEYIGNRYLAVHIDAFSPETFVEFHAFQCQGSDLFSFAFHIRLSISLPFYTSESDSFDKESLKKYKQEQYRCECDDGRCQ